MVFINSPNGRKLVEATLVKKNTSTIIVRLPDGHTITRKIKRDVPK